MEDVLNALDTENPSVIERALNKYVAEQVRPFAEAIDRADQVSWIPSIMKFECWHCHKTSQIPHVVDHSEDCPVLAARKWLEENPK